MLRFPALIVVLVSAALFCQSATLHNTSAGAAPVSRAGSITLATPMLEARSGHSATLLPNGKVLIVGGMRRNQDFYRSAELYDPATEKFQPTGLMAVARFGNVAVLLPTGKVLVAGGWVGHDCTDSAELYDPATAKFQSLSKMTARRGRPNATLLATGDVLITGGADHDAPGGVATAEIFRSVDSRFEPLGPMHYPRIAHTTTLLPDGRVLIAGDAAQPSPQQPKSLIPPQINSSSAGACSPPATSTLPDSFPMAAYLSPAVPTIATGQAL